LAREQVDVFNVDFNDLQRELERGWTSGNQYISPDWNWWRWETPPVPAIIQNWDLGAGESAVLSWGYANPGTEVIIDDLSARRCATTLGIPVRGTLGLVLTAKQRGAIPAARPVLEQLLLSGMYLSERIINQALKLVGEWIMSKLTLLKQHD
jgi:predicted nucleic acid-binding protein